MDYHAAAYFTPPFFGASHGSEVVGVPDDLVNALVAWVQQGMVPASLSWFGTGVAPPRVALPYALIEEFEETPDYQSEDEHGTAPFDDVGEIPVAVYHATSDEVKALARTLEKRINNAPLAFTEGDLLYLRRAGKVWVGIDPHPAPGGGDCWTAKLKIRSIVAKYT